MRIEFEAYRPTPALRGHLALGARRGDGKSVEATSRCIERDGRPCIPVMGEYHYSRDARAHWREELAKMKAGGVTIVSTYAFWNVHEEIEGEADFSGGLDLRAFVRACGEQGLYVLLRIGPYAHGEARCGGFPDWLLRKGVPLRTDDEAYLALARSWYRKLFSQARGLLWKDGGPIAGVQIENELVDDAAHLATLKRIAIEEGFDVPLYTATGWNSPYGARIPEGEFLPVFAAYCEAPWADHLRAEPRSPHYAFDPTRNLTAMGLDPDARDADGWRLPYERTPYAMCELGGGLQNTFRRRIRVTGMDVYAMALVKLGCGCNLMGYYMYHGGANRIGRLGPLQESRAAGDANDLPILDYGFQACLNQYGQAGPQYAPLTMLHLFLADFGALLAPMEHVPAREFVPCTDDTRLRCCLRTDGESGFLFVNHYQRGARLADVAHARLCALGETLPPIDVRGDAAFLLPLRLPLGSARLLWATAHPVCRQGHTTFFAEIDGIPARYRFARADGTAYTVAAQAGFGGGFVAEGERIVTLPWAQATHLRRLDGEVLVGEGCDLYVLDGELRAIGGGAFAYRRWTGEGFELLTAGREEPQAALQMQPVPEPFVPPYAQELQLGGATARAWTRLTVACGAGMVALPGPYGVAQIYADGELVADHFYAGEPWRVPAAMLYGKTCYLVTAPQTEETYFEYLGQSKKTER